jgi:putative SOS response-associated peptidase YedK
MPVILPPGYEREWLRPGAVSLFQPFLSELITAYPVTPKINNANFNEPAAVAALEPAIQ